MGPWERWKRRRLARTSLTVVMTSLFCVSTASARADPAPAPSDSTAAREAELFGAPDQAAPAAATPRPQVGARDPRGAQDGQQHPAPEPGPPDLEQRLLSLGTDRLQVGGLLYLRSNWNITNGNRVEDHPISMPSLVDVYLDARPSDRVRAFVRGRLAWNPAISETPTPVPVGSNGTTGATDAATAVAAFGGGTRTAVMLNELWLKFDIARRVFVTLGQQLLRWGTSRLWNPTDVVNQTRRPLLDPFDQRNGVPLLKLHVPVEALGWNFYLIGMLDGVSSLDKAGVVGRAELVLSTLELGLVGAYRDGLDPTAGLDLSVGIWDFDLTSELALKFDERFSHNIALRVTAGLQYNMAVFDDDMFIVGAEYFYNQEGHDDIDPVDLFTGALQYFYAGRHYAAVYATLPAPGKLLDDWTFTGSVIGNLSDLSAVARLDVSVKVLTYLMVQAYAMGHMGKHGELRLGDSAFPAASRDVARALYSPDDPTRPIPTQILQLGLWLRVDL